MTALSLFYDVLSFYIFLAVHVSSVHVIDNFTVNNSFRLYLVQTLRCKILLQTNRIGLKWTTKYFIEKKILVVISKRVLEFYNILQ